MLLLLAPGSAYAVVPSLTPVLVALLPQLLLFLLMTLLLLVRPRTWIRAIAWGVRHPVRGLAAAAAIGGFGWGAVWLFSGGPAAAGAPAWEPPKPACGYEGQYGGPGHTYASDSRGADPVGPNLEPDVRWIAKDVSVFSVSSEGKHVFTVSGAGKGSDLDVWQLADGQHLWSVAHGGVDPPLVPADGSGRVLDVGGRGLLVLDGERGGLPRTILGPEDETVKASPAFRFGRLVVPTSNGIRCYGVGDLKSARPGGEASSLRPWLALGFGCDWTMLALDEQARAYAGNGEEIACLDLLSGGRTCWRRRPGGRVGAPAWSAGWLYVAHEPAGAGGPEIVCLDPETPDGAVAWRLPLPGLRAETLVAAGKSRLVVPVETGGAAALAVVDTIRRAVAVTVPLDAPPAQPVVLADAGDGAAYVLDRNNRVSRIALKTGRVSWKVDLGAAANGPMILADGMLLVPTKRGVAVLE